MARYLAYLDEVVFQKGVIAGVITIASPNYGSPLGNPKNKESVFDGLIELILSILSFTQVKYPGLMKHTKDEVDFENLIKFLEKLFSGLKDSDLKDMEGQESMARTITTAIKWLGGLDEDEKNAFHELSILDHDDASTVLACVNGTKLDRVAYASVVTANNNLERIFYSFIRDFIGGVKGYLVRSVLSLFSSILSLFGRGFKDDFELGSKIYKKKVMKEQLKPGDYKLKDIIPLKIEEYEKGSSSPKIDPEAHDFIIPSCYQTVPTNGKNYLGTKVNKDASHNSGKSRESKGGKKNYKYIKQYLKIMKPFILDLKP